MRAKRRGGFKVKTAPVSQSSAECASVRSADDTNGKSLAHSRGRHRPEEPDTTARGHSDRSRREGCGTEEGVGGQSELWIWDAMRHRCFSAKSRGGSRTSDPKIKPNLTNKERRRDQRARA